MGIRGGKSQHSAVSDQRSGKAAHKETNEKLRSLGSYRFDGGFSPNTLRC
jgi:hypothetical protein